MALASADPRLRHRGPPVGSTARAEVLRAEGVTVSYDALDALDQLDVVVRAGELVALAGENGAGKSTLVRCVAGDVAPSSGRLLLDGAPVVASPAAMARRGVAVVWQDLALCPNLDVASNLLLGKEPGRLLRSTTRLHTVARALLDELGIPIRETAQGVASLSGGQRQLLAVARAVRDTPRLLVLDEPTASLGVAETAQVESLIATLRRRGTTVLLISHDLDQMCRLADRVLVLRRGRLVADVDPASVHPDEIIAAMAGQQIDSSARRQLDRLHGLVESLANAEPASTVPLILSALGTALGSNQVALHLADGHVLRAAASIGLPAPLEAAWRVLPLGAAGGPPGLAAARAEVVVEPDVAAAPGWRRWMEPALPARVGSAWSVPVTGTAGLTGVITVLLRASGRPPRAQLDLVAVYAGHLANALERERLLGQVTTRNRNLETIRDILQTVAGPGSLDRRLSGSLRSLRSGLQAEEVGLVIAGGTERWEWRAHDGAPGEPSARLTLAAAALDDTADGPARPAPGVPATLVAPVAAPGHRAALIARWRGGPVPGDAAALLEDAANSLRLALEREEAQRANQEAAAARRSQDLQRQFLSRLSHELRTPLTAIRGYASSLMQPDVTWDDASESRFLGRIAAESARLGRLVDDLLDFSAIESSVMRLHPDWCDLRLVLDAAVACLDADARAAVHLDCPPDIPVVLADHDRLEQVFVNLLDNAVRHNPPGTAVSVQVDADPTEVRVEVVDDGVGIPEEVLAGAGPVRGRRQPSAGAGLGLSIARGIVAAHGGRLTVSSSPTGTSFRVELPVEGAVPAEPA